MAKFPMGRASKRPATLVPLGATVSKNVFVIDPGPDFALNETADFGIGYSGKIETNGNIVHLAAAVISAKF